MTKELLYDFCMSLEGVEVKTPFQKFVKDRETIFAFYVGGHIFCFVEMDSFENCTVKSSPEKIAELVEEYEAVRRPFNLSPKYWISLWFCQDMPDREILELIRESYETVKQRKR